MFLRTAILAVCAVNILGCTEFEQIDPDQLDKRNGTFLVVTNEKEIYELNEMRFFCNHLTGIGKRYRGSGFAHEEFQGRIPYETVTFLGRERFSLPKNLYAAVWILTFFGFYSLLRGGKTQHSQTPRLHSSTIVRSGDRS
jgi:hypothetical protein